MGSFNHLKRIHHELKYYEFDSLNFMIINYNLSILITIKYLF